MYVLCNEIVFDLKLFFKQRNKEKRKKRHVNRHDTEAQGLSFMSLSFMRWLVGSIPSQKQIQQPLIPYKCVLVKKK